ncbi:hypothetical protein BJV82DRAFT_526262, partial [Fennellomyces sp. T-0311]
YRDFFIALNDQTTYSFSRPAYDIQPAIQHIHDLGSNDNMRPIDLTCKLCFLLAITRFLRPSDIERVDDAHSEVTSTQLRLVVVRPKEKRSSQRIKKVIHVRRHQVTYLCPVTTYEPYKAPFCQQPCVRRYPAQGGSRSTVHNLIRAVHNNHVPVGSECISNHIKYILAMILRPPGTTMPKARALGAAAAVLGGASLDDVLVHGSWASSSDFDTFYRVSRDTATNFTMMALPLESPDVTLDTQSGSVTPADE